MRLLTAPKRPTGRRSWHTSEPREPLSAASLRTSREPLRHERAAVAAAAKGDDEHAREHRAWADDERDAAAEGRQSAEEHE